MDNSSPKNTQTQFTANISNQNLPSQQNSNSNVSNSNAFLFQQPNPQMQYPVQQAQYPFQQAQYQYQQTQYPAQQFYQIPVNQQIPGSYNNYPQNNKLSEIFNDD
jgi:hypothetical protein